MPLVSCMPRTEPFEKYSDRYDDWFETHRDVYQSELAVVRALLPPPPARGMEVGVGSGRFAVPLGIDIGVEPAGQMAIRAEKQGIRVFRQVAENLPFADCGFDFVLMVTTICFVDDVLTSFQEAFRVLKPCGCLVVGFIDRKSALGREYCDRREASRFYRDAVFFSAYEVEKYLTEAGFGNLTFMQTLIPGESPELIQDGFGQGGFVAARGMKPG